MTAKQNFEMRFRSAIGNLDFCKLFKNGGGALLILIFYSASAQNLSVQMTINGDPYHTAGYLNMCTKNIICLKVTNNTGSTQTINARVGMLPSIFHVVDIGSFSFVGGAYHEYQVSDSYSAYEEKEFCIEFVLLTPDYGSHQNRFGGSIVPPSGPSDQTSTLFTMPNVNMSGITFVGGDPILLSEAISNSLMLDQSNSYNTDQFIYVDGILQIDESYTYKGEIIFGPNAKITVDQGLFFSLGQADLRGCYYMWGGIDIDPSFISLGGSSIQDAAYGLNVLTDDPQYVSSLIIQNSHFLNNYIGIDIKESGNGISSQHALRLTATIFEANDILKPIYDNEYPEINVVAYAGLRVNNHRGISLRNPLTTPNVLFKGMPNGIILIDANLRIRDVNFENIQPSNYYPSGGFLTPNGSGIHALRSYLYTDEAGPLIFSNVNHCITSWTTELSVNGIEAEDVSMGVNIISPWIHKSTVKNSTIEAKRFGIRYLLESHENSTFHFENNSINIGTIGENTGTSGIWVNPLGVPQIKKYTPKIIDNTIELDKALHGIFVRNIKGIRKSDLPVDYIAGGIDILRNEVNIIEDRGFGRSGIQIESSRFPYVCGNTVSSDDNYEDYTIAYDFRNATDAEIRLNNLDYTRKGFQFWGNCVSPERFNYNFLKRHHIALCIGVDENNPVGVIGGQSRHRQNLWFNSPLNSGFNAANYEREASGPSNSNVFKVLDLSNYRPEGVHPSMWIDINGNDPQPTPEICLEVYPVVMFNIDDEQIAFDSITFSQFEEELRWSAKYELMIELYAMDSTDRATEYAVMDTFFHDNKNGSFGSFASFTLEMQQIASMDSTREDELKDYYIDILDLLDDMLGHYGDSIGEIPDSIDYVYNFASLASLGSLKTDLDSLKATILSEQDAAYATLLTQLSSLPDTLDIEYNLKYSLNATIEYMISHNLDSILTEFEELEDIANLCPMEGGPGVYIARDLLVHLDLVYDDEIACMIAESRSRNSEETLDPNHSLNISIFPNPVHQDLTVKWEEIEREVYQISIKDNSGRVIDFKIFPSVTTGITQFNTGQFPNGIYFIHLESRDGTLIDTRKFTVTH